MLKTDINKINKIYKTNTVHLSVSLKHLTTTRLELRVVRITIFQSGVSVYRTIILSIFFLFCEETYLH